MIKALFVNKEIYMCLYFSLPGTRRNVKLDNFLHKGRRGKKRRNQDKVLSTK